MIPDNFYDGPNIRHDLASLAGHFFGLGLIVNDTDSPKVMIDKMTRAGQEIEHFINAFLEKYPEAAK